MANITNGITVSFGNTPQAGDDFFTTAQTGLSEDTVKIVYLNVMANDLGGAAKTLYSLDSGTEATTALEQQALLVQDTARVENISTDYSANGAHIWITADGKVGYDANTFSTAFKAQLNALSAGEFATDTFNYAIRLGNGALSWATATVQIAGTNDHAVLSGQYAGAITEDQQGHGAGRETASGALTLSDVDLHDHHTVTGVAASAGALGTLAAWMSQDTTGTGTGGEIKWTYSVADSAIDHLAAGATKVETFTVSLFDGTSTVTKAIAITLTGTNDAPVITGTVHGSAIEDGSVVTLNALANASDVDDGTILSVVGLPVALPAGVTFDAATHTFSLDPSHYQHLAGGETTTVTVNYGVSDGLATTSQSVQFTITGQNDAPTVSAIVTAAVAEDAAVFTVNLLDYATDVDHGAVLHVANVGALPAGVTLVGNTLQVDPSDATFQHLAAGAAQVITVGFNVVDEFGSAVAQTAQITVTGTNDAPVVSGTVHGSTLEDGSVVTLNALAHASDVDDGAILSVVGLPAALPAGVTFDATTHTFSLDPNHADYQHLAAGETTTVTVNYGVSDGLATTPESVQFTITGTNDAPVALAINAGANEDGPSVTLTAAYSDVDSQDNHSFSVDTSGTLGTVVNHGDGTFTYSPNGQFESLAAGETAADTFTYTVTDNHGASTTQTATVTITGQNDAPTVSAIVTAAAAEDAAVVTVSLLDHAADVDHGAVLHVASVGALPAGVTLVGDTLQVDPSDATFQHLAAGATQVITVGYNVVDEFGSAVAQSAQITVTGTNDAPVVSGMVVGNAVEDGSALTLDALAHASDVDDGAILSVVDVPASLPAGVTFDAAPHAFSLDPSHADYQHLAAGQTATVTVNYGISDGLATTPASVQFTVTGTNDAPVVTGLVSGNAVEDGSVVTLNALANANDVDEGAILTVVDVPATLPAGVMYDAASHTFSLDPGHANYQHLAAGETAIVTVNYGVSDGLAITPASMQFTVTGTNDAPVVSGTVVGNAVEDGSVVTLNALAHASDVDDGAILSVVGLPAALPGGVTFDAATHTFSLDPSHADYQHLAAGETTTVTVNYGVSDGLATTPESVQFTVTGQNDTPLNTAPATQTINEDSTLVFSAGNANQISIADIDNTSHTVTLTATHGAISLSGTAGLIFATGDGTADDTMTFSGADAAINTALNGLSFLGDANFNGAASLQIVTGDGMANATDTVNIAVNSVNDAPAGADKTVTMLEDSSYTLAASDFGFTDSSDSPSNSLQAVKITTLPSAGSLTDNGVEVTAGQLVSLADIVGGHLVFTPATNANGSSYASFTFQVQDDGGGSNGGVNLDSSPNTLAFAVTAVDDAPVNTVPGTQTTNEDTAKVISGLSIADVDAGASNLTVTLSVAHGALAVASVAGGASMAGNGTASVTLTGTVAQIDATLAANVMYTPTVNFNGNDTLTMVTNDLGHTGSGGPLSDTDTVAITVNPVNDAPVATSDVVYVSNNTNGIIIPVDTLLGNDTDIDGLALSITSLSSASGGVSSVGFVPNTNNSLITFSSNNSSSGGFNYTLSDGAGGSVTGQVTVNIVSTNGTATVDLSSVSYQAAYLDGGSNNDSLSGSSAPDIFLGGAANDTLIGGSGNDILRGGAGNDTLDGGAGTDLLDCSDATAALNLTLVQSSSNTNVNLSAVGLGTDTYKNMEGVIGSAFNDTLNGSSGNDLLRGGAGNDTLDGGTGIDLLDFSDAIGAINFTLVQSGSNTTVNLSAVGLGSDTYKNMEGVSGTAFNDTLNGSSVNDMLKGGDGNDTLAGGSGNDLLVGGSGVDILTGGAGSDTFAFFKADASAVDTITDFHTNESDVLDISDLLISYNAASASSFISLRESGSNTIVGVDRDGAGSTYSFQDIAVLQGATGLNLNTLLTDGNIHTV